VRTTVRGIVGDPQIGSLSNNLEAASKLTSIAMHDTLTTVPFDRICDCMGAFNKHHVICLEKEPING
jgi:hypothetical protein